MSITTTSAPLFLTPSSRGAACLQTRQARICVLMVLLLALPFSGHAGAQDTPAKTQTTAKIKKSAKVAPGGTAAGKANKKTAANVAKNAASFPASASGFSRPSALPRVPPSVVLPAPVITYFNQDAKDWLRVGDVMHVTLQGTAGGQAAFRVANFPDAVPMQETTPGLYIGNWPVPTGRPLALPSAPIAGELSMGGKAATQMTSSRPLAIDTIPPRADNITPAAQSVVATTSPVISADLTDQGSGINASAVRLVVNGRDLTGEANVTTERIVYKPIVPLLAGDQTVLLLVADRAGNKYQQTWRFTVTLK